VFTSFETLTSQHALKCNLVTGQERQQQHGAKHTACTVSSSSSSSSIATFCIGSVCYSQLPEH
jgi:hypothetical protein